MPIDPKVIYGVERCPHCGCEDLHEEPGMNPGEGGEPDEPVDTRPALVCNDCGDAVAHGETLADRLAWTG